jgi:hypothetical protein
MLRTRVALAVGILVSGVVAAGPSTTSNAASTAGSAGAAEPLCEQRPTLCPDPATRKDYDGNYVGHDEPALEFYSSRPGSGNQSSWTLRLPREAPVQPKADGSGGTWNFQRSVAFWFGMDLCESQSYPTPGHPCTPDSDANIKNGTDPNSPDWMGNHVGTGFLELQFYPPGWVPLGAGVSCDPTKWCAAMAVFGLSASPTSFNNDDCLERAGEEWVDYAFVTRNGRPQAPPDPLNQTAATFAPDPSKVLLMNAGDEVHISIHDSAAGLVNSLTDVTSGEHGSMTASVANGFAHPVFDPTATTCTEESYAFHPMYATSSQQTLVPWTVHTYNVSFSDEIGHFGYCSRAHKGVCVRPGAGDPTPDTDETSCFNANQSLLINVGGCVASDTDFDGTSYQRDWSGTLSDARIDRKLHSESFRITSPLTNGRNYQRMAFETDLPAIEPCGLDGTGCVNPPDGAQFYPLYSTRRADGGGCAWQEGGTHIPGTTNTFGGSSTTEYGPELASYYPGDPGFPAGTYVSNFRRTLDSNPCPSAG